MPRTSPLHGAEKAESSSEPLIGFCFDQPDMNVEQDRSAMHPSHCRTGPAFMLTRTLARGSLQRRHREVLRFHSAFLLVTFLWQDKEK
ncbi:hypothetical protein K6W16_24830 [Burkholderia dolosa]|uniref:Uncharacterized protein n=1 Tax=Burkholderia dolosa TaxID=152500 RepID=A0A892I465_9BURK|nr:MULTISPECIES: hypothetical protein [Burkholderia]MBR8316779.1 hypothetical protein [Burkholderia dolosa]MBR8420978.1 hypothetical protein [Burkholderia dolosa]MBY4660901.1 hypothetical protein [Burkholderia dolosa]MBY4692199.1 hypothetical protein [Burkholderia dolosa]MBY4785177.1 hypothetical protein [Burkholderia dolosa]